MLDSVSNGDMISFFPSPMLQDIHSYRKQKNALSIVFIVRMLLHSKIVFFYILYEEIVLLVE